MLNLEERGKLRVGGGRPKTHEGHVNAIKQFNKFVDLARNENKGIGPNKLMKFYDEWTSHELANEEV